MMAAVPAACCEHMDSYEELSVVKDRLRILLKVNADRIDRDRRTTALEQSLRSQLAAEITRVEVLENRLRELGEEP